MRNGVSIPSGAEADLIAREFGLHKQEYILYLGRLVPEKGIHYLLEAFRDVKTEKKLVIAGNIDKTEYVSMICREAEKDSRVIMTNFVQGRMLEELFSNCFLYVLPSEVEGMAISLLEAMSYGAHCLLSDIDENKEAAEDHADYFANGDVKMLRKKLQELVDADAAYDVEGQKQFVAARYDWKKINSETLDIYQRAIQKKTVRKKR